MTAFGHVNAFIEEARQADDLDALSDRFDAVLGQLGFSSFTYVANIRGRQRDEDHLVISQYPQAWIDHYVEQEYYLLDPVALHVHHRHTPFSWRGAITRKFTGRQQRILDEARQFGIHDGMTIPLHHYRRHPGSLNLVYETDSAETGPDNSHCAHIAGLHFHEAAQRLTGRAEIQDSRLLTERERECLCWVAIGKSDWEIGEILGISASTAHFHVENAKKKLDVHSRMQAVIQAFLNGEIMP